MRITVFGTGYLGATHAACMAELGHEVLGVDVDPAKLAKLEAGEVPFYEPGLEELIKRNTAEGRLTFTTDLASAVRDSLVCFIAVGTPQGEDGAPDMRYVHKVAEDIADVAVAALTEAGHNGEVYEVTGPRLMTFDDVASELSRATGRKISFVRVPSDVFLQGFRQAGAPEEMIWLLDYLFSTILDGRNAQICDGVERALGRPPKDFSDFAYEVAASGLWSAAA